MRFPMCPVWMLVLSLMWLQGAVAVSVRGKELINLSTTLPRGYNGQLEIGDRHFIWRGREKLQEFLLMNPRGGFPNVTSVVVFLDNLNQITTTPKRILIQFDADVMHYLCFCRKFGEILVGTCGLDNKIYELVSFRPPTKCAEFVFYPSGKLIADVLDGPERWRRKPAVTYQFPRATIGNAYQFQMSLVDSFDVRVGFSPGFIATTNYAVATTTVATTRRRVTAPTPAPRPTDPTAAAPTFRRRTEMLGARTIRPPAPRSKNRRNCVAAVGLFTVWQVLLLILVEF